MEQAFANDGLSEFIMAVRGNNCSARMSLHCWSVARQRAVDGLATSRPCDDRQCLRQPEHDQYTAQVMVTRVTSSGTNKNTNRNSHSNSKANTDGKYEHVPVASNLLGSSSLARGLLRLPRVPLPGIRAQGF